ncbi:uncharacterized protein METZ01_LOCUS257891 [marine metagenome]|uniref:Uncharacterized protein n=1 Tax=marine metagenome TaxID=408172 RepID=A0A382J0V6_9ZZZZ
MIPNKENIKHKINQLDYEIKMLENKINEMSWQRTKYQQFYEKCSAGKNNSKSV